MNSPAAVPMEIDVQTVKRWRDEQREFFLLDCREQDEFDQARIAGATLIPMSTLAARVAELEPHRDRPLVVHCHHGGRSLQVAAWLRRQGFDQTQSMQGGIDQWSVQIDPGVARY